MGATFIGPFTNTQIDFACLPVTVQVHRCCALHHDGYRLQLSAAPGRRDHRPKQCVFQHQLAYGIHEKRQDHQWDKNKLTQGALFAQNRTTFLDTGRGSMPARRGVDPSDGHRIFGRNSTKCSWTLALTCTPKKLRPRSELLRIHWMRDMT